MSGPAGPKDRSGIWILPLATHKLSKLIDDALGGAALSPDQSQIIFRRTSVPEIWIMKSNGAKPRRLLTIPGDSIHDSRLAWFPNGRRFAFASASRSGDEFAIHSYDLESGKTQLILSDRKAGDFCLASDGRIVYSRLEDPPNEKSANLWEADIDLGTGQIRGMPRRLTNWPGSQFASLTSTRDSKHLSYVRLHFQNTVYVGELKENDTRLTNPRRFLFEQWTNWPTGWSRDGQAVLFNSDSTGQSEIFKQPIAARNVEALASGKDERSDARLSPDGKWLLYLEWPGTGPKTSTANGRLMRTGVEGGPAQALFTISGYSRRIRTDPLVSISAEGHPAFRCSSEIGAPCVLSEEIEGNIVFTAFDPKNGKGAELYKAPTGSFTFWDLSQNGRWIAVGRNDEASGRIQLISLAGEPPRDIEAGGWTRLVSASWASSGKGLFVTAFASKGAPLLYVPLVGQTRLLYRGLKYVENPVASPDGRYLAFGEMTEDGNAWVLNIARNTH